MLGSEECPWRSRNIFILFPFSLLYFLKYLSIPDISGKSGYFKESSSQFQWRLKS